MSGLFDLSGRLALVTGSSRGLGLTMARGLREAGAAVVVHGRDPDALDRAGAAIAQDGGPRPATMAVDVTDAGAVESAVEDLVAEHGVPDILVNNAGIQRRAPFEQFAVGDWDDLVAANLSAPFYVSRFLTPAMVERGSGKIINVGSVQSVLARTTIAPYGATKAGLVMLTRGMAADLARHGIQVNAISPGYFRTEMNAALTADEDFTRWLSGRTPAGRWGDPAELIGTLVYLASDASSFVSGQNVVVDGGLSAVV